MEFETVTPQDTELNGEQPAIEAPEQEAPNWQAILDAPDYLTLLKGRKSPVALEYEQKVQSVLKEIFKARLGAGTYSGLADVAATLKLGPDFAERAGILAAADDKAKKAIDIITAPDNPWVMFAFAAIPLVSQYIRNHESQVKAIPGAMKKTRAERKAERAARPKAKITIPFIKKEITVPFKFRIHISIFRQNSMEPNYLINEVMGSNKVRETIERKYGVKIGATSDTV